MNRWTSEEDARLIQAVYCWGVGRWIDIAKSVGTRTRQQCAQRWTRTLNPCIRKGRWSLGEDMMLLDLVLPEDVETKRISWRQVGRHIGRSGRQCRERWFHLSHHPQQSQQSQQIQHTQHTQHGHQTQPEPPVGIIQPKPLYHIDMVSKKFAEIFSQV